MTSRKNQTAEQRMAAVGDYETVLPFQAVGVEPFIPGNEVAEMRQVLQRLAATHAVVFLMERWFEELRELVDELNDTFPVSIMPIPDQRGSWGVGVRNIKKSVEQAVGMDIFSVQS